MKGIGIWLIGITALLALLTVMGLFNDHAQLIVQTAAGKTVYTLTWGGKMEVK